MTDIEIDKTISKFESVGDHRYGWDTLFRDPKTREFWELIYPPDGKPRELRPITAHDARLRYSAAFSSKQSEVHDYWLGAVRKVVGIGLARSPGNRKVSFQAARSIG
jgi:hypothetical protein